MTTGHLYLFAGSLVGRDLLVPFFSLSLLGYSRCIISVNLSKLLAEKGSFGYSNGQAHFSHDVNEFLEKAFNRL